MSAPPLRIHRLAFREFTEAYVRYGQHSERTQSRFVAAFDQAQQKIIDFPLLWPLFRKKFRWLKLARFPYIIYYRVQDDGSVRILALAHDKRRPGYWLGRVGRA